MLQLRPVCEHCAVLLPPSSSVAMICSFECTFCQTCVHDLLANVCPNCGGGFCPRPIRPRNHWKNGNYLGEAPAETLWLHRPVDLEEHARFAEPLQKIEPSNR
ncbi:MAG: DUF1272 domain-containing protein [Opitutus sp.]|jgi:hypothetical protein